MREIDPRTPGVVDALVGTLADPSDEVRLAAANSLTHDGTLLDASVPSVLAALADTARAHTREHVALLLRDVSPAAPPRVVKALRTQHRRSSVSIGSRPAEFLALWTSTVGVV